jgi:diguanylate cyclase (GGDEF)-like protein
MQKVELLKRIANHPNIPSPPTVVLQVLEKASKRDCTIADLCQIIQMDPGMSSRILRIVNSATFGLSRAVTSIQRALAVVGLNSARLIVLALSFPDMQRKMHAADQAVKQRYWKSSVAGAVVARELSRAMRSKEPEDDMAAGLLRDLGELVLQQMMPEEYGTVLAQPVASLINDQIDLEEIHCGLDHAEVSAFILDRWRLPAEMTEAIHHHHHPDAGVFAAPRGQDRAYLLHFATRAAQLLLHPDQPLVLKSLRELAQNHYKMTEQELHDFLLPLSNKINDFAALLQIDIGEASDYEDVLDRANDELINLTVAANLDNQRANESTRRAESEARHWREEAAYDPLTKVFNRRFLESKLRDLCERSELMVEPFGLLFIDLDGFKPLNDRFGHTFGDLALQMVADCLSGQVRQQDIVARYGGDEFCVLFETIDQVGLHKLSNRIWQTINDLTITQGENRGRVGASIGAVLFEPGTEMENASSVLSAADRAMYAAKAEGKNRVVFWNSRTMTAKAAPVGECLQPLSS